MKHSLFRSSTFLLIALLLFAPIAFAKQASYGPDDVGQDVYDVARDLAKKDGKRIKSGDPIDSRYIGRAQKTFVKDLDPVIPNYYQLLYVENDHNLPQAVFDRGLALFEEEIGPIAEKYDKDMANAKKARTPVARKRAAKKVVAKYDKQYLNFKSLYNNLKKKKVPAKYILQAREELEASGDVLIVDYSAIVSSDAPAHDQDPMLFNLGTHVQDTYSAEDLPLALHLEALKGFDMLIEQKEETAKKVKQKMKRVRGKYRSKLKKSYNGVLKQIESIKEEKAEGIVPRKYAFDAKKRLFAALSEEEKQNVWNALLMQPHEGVEEAAKETIEDAISFDLEANKQDEYAVDDLPLPLYDKAMDVYYTKIEQKEDKLNEKSRDTPKGKAIYDWQYRAQKAYQNAKKEFDTFAEPFMRDVVPYTYVDQAQKLLAVEVEEANNPKIEEPKDKALDKNSALYEMAVNIVQNDVSRLNRRMSALSRSTRGQDPDAKGTIKAYQKRIDALKDQVETAEFNSDILERAKTKLNHKRKQVNDPNEDEDNGRYTNSESEGPRVGLDGLVPDYPDTTPQPAQIIKDEKKPEVEKCNPLERINGADCDNPPDNTNPQANQGPKYYGDEERASEPPEGSLSARETDNGGWIVKSSLPGSTPKRVVILRMEKQVLEKVLSTYSAAPEDNEALMAEILDGPTAKQMRKDIEKVKMEYGLEDLENSFPFIFHVMEGGLLIISDVWDEEVVSTKESVVKGTDLGADVIKNSRADVMDQYEAVLNLIDAAKDAAANPLEATERTQEQTFEFILEVSELELNEIMTDMSLIISKDASWTDRVRIGVSTIRHIVSAKKWKELVEEGIEVTSKKSLRNSASKIDDIDLDRGISFSKEPVKGKETLLQRKHEKHRFVEIVDEKGNKELVVDQRVVDALGVDLSPSPKHMPQIEAGIVKHVTNKDTQVIKGTFMGDPATHYFDPKTRFNVVKDQNGEFRDYYFLNEGEVPKLLQTGQVGKNRNN